MRRRRLRQWQRHEQVTVAMALAEATHHAAPTETEASQCHEGGGGASYACRPTGTEDPSTRGVAVHPAGALAAEK